MTRFDAVIFDMDGTLISQEIDFAAIRLELGLPAGEGILEAIATWPDDLRREAEEVLLSHELFAADGAELKSGARETLDGISAAGLKTALLTRNAGRVMQMIIERFDLRFDVSWSRDCAPIKPAPDGVLLACEALGVTPGKAVCVGDFHYDILAANAAGATSVLLAEGDAPSFADEADHVITALPQLLDILEL